MRNATTLEIRSKFVHIGLPSFVRGIVCWEGDRVSLALTHKDSKGLTKALEVSSCFRKIGCRCVVGADLSTRTIPPSDTQLQALSHDLMIRLRFHTTKQQILSLIDIITLSFMDTEPAHSIKLPSACRVVISNCAL